MTKGLVPWSKYANSLSRDQRRWAEEDCLHLVNNFRESGDWRALLVSATYVLAERLEHKRHSYSRKLFAEALTRELETVSLEEILMKNLLGGN